MRTTIIIFISFLFFQTSFAVTTTWTGASNQFWNTAGNWNNGIPGSGDDVIIPDVSGASGNFPLFTGTSSDIECNNLTINSGATLTLSSSDASKFLDVYGNIVVNGTIDGTNATLILLGSTKTISGTPTDVSAVFLYARGGSSYTLNSNWSIDNLQTQDVGSTFNVASGVTLTSDFIYNRSDCSVILLGTGSLDINSTCAIIPEADATFTMNSGTLYCNGNLGGNTSATFNAGTGTVVLDGSTSTEITATYSFYNLTIAKDATDDIVTCNDADDDITVTNNLVITEGTLQPTLADLTVNGTTTLTDGEIIGGEERITLTGDVTLNNDAYLTIASSTNDIRTAGSLTMNNTSGVRNTGGATQFIRLYGTSSHTISCNTAANSSSARVVMGNGEFDYTLNSDWQIAYLQMSNTTGGTADFVVADGNTLTVDGDINPFHNDINFTLNGTANLDCNGSLTTACVFTMNTGTLSITTNFTNSHTFTDGSSTVVFDGSANSVIDDPDGIEFYNLTINKDATADVVSCNDADADITVANNLTITEGTLSPTLADCSVTGTTTLTDGKYIGIDAATTFTGDITMNNDAIIDHQATVENGDINIAGSITMNGTSGIQSSTATDRWIDLNGATKTISVTTAANSSTSNFNLNSGASYTLNNSLTINKFYMSTGVNSFTVADGQTFTLNSTIYTQANSSFTLTGAANMNIAGDAWLAHFSGCTFTLNTGTLDVDGDLRCTGSGAGTFNANSGTVRVAGNIPNSGGNTGTFDWGTSTLEMNGTSGTLIMTAGGSSLYNLVFNDGGGTATYEIQEAIDVNGDLTITGGTLDTKAASNFNINLAGHWTNNDGFTVNAAKVVFDGGANQDISGASVTAFHDIEIANTSGDVDLNDDATVSGTLTLTSGDLIIETAETLTIDDTDDSGISGGSASTHIVTSGTATIIDTYSSTTKITYPLGDGTNYRPLALTPSSTNSTIWTIAYTAVGHSDTDVSGDLDHISSMEYWTCDRSGGSPADAIMELTWHSGSVVNDYANLTIAHYDGTTDWDGIASTPVGTNSSGTITSDAAVTTFSPFTIGSISSANPLPIRILYFDVRFNEKFDHVILDWRTASEKNNDYFSIERSVDGINWIKIGEVNGAGTSNIPVSYQYFDFDVFRGLTYYRLKQVDFDGEFDYSDIKLVNFQKAENLVYPNPSSGEFYINGVKEENDNVLVINSLSELVFSGKLQNNKINLSFLSKGIYFLIINNQSEKIIIE